MEETADVSTETTESTIDLLNKKGLQAISELVKQYSEEELPQVYTFLQSVTGVDFTDTAALNAISTVKATDIRNKLLGQLPNLLSLHAEMRKQDLDNTKDAREHATIAASLPFRQQCSFSNMLATYLIVFSTLFCAAMVFIPIPPNNARFADTIIGFLLGTIISTVINFYYGSAMTAGTPVSSKSRK